MNADTVCLTCCRKKAEGLLEQYRVSEETRNTLLKRIDKFLADGKRIENMPAPVIMAEILSIVDEKVEIMDAYEKPKKKYNRKLISMEEAEKLVYITDNAGEIVLDKVFIRVLKKLYPQLDITVIVRGFPTLNDATYEDAEDIGLTDMVNVMPNGTDVPGTPIDEIDPEVRHLIDEADLCIAKGQGNFETLHGSGRNIFYLFLCKCELFTRKFQTERFTPILNNELRIVQNA